MLPITLSLSLIFSSFKNSTPFGLKLVLFLINIKDLVCYNGTSISPHTILRRNFFEEICNHSNLRFTHRNYKRVYHF
ncbi:predicted protein [Enterococcus casseliflavus EC30]|nr:predicted protein [Enterococcus casseliflavus EC30]